MNQDIHLKSEAETALLAQCLKPVLQAGDQIFLSGDLGAGKTAFARAFIQAHMQDHEAIEDVPSPSFTLVQTYEFEDLDIWHVDLYRLETAELHELGLEDAFEDALVLIEWPDRLVGAFEPTLSINLTLSDEGARFARIVTKNADVAAAIKEFSGEP